MSVPCGCRHCGCVCEQHSRSRQPELCAVHVVRAVSRYIGDEAVRLLGVALFAAMVIAWAAILT